MGQAIAVAAMEIVSPVIASLGYELVDVVHVKRGTEWFLEFYIDKECGVTVDDCETASRAAESVLDAAPAFAGKMDHLVFSSPGLDRPLKTDRDFERRLGEALDVRLYSPVNGRRELTGELVSFDGSGIALRAGGDTVAIDRKNVALARLHLNMNLEDRS